MFKRLFPVAVAAAAFAVPASAATTVTVKANPLNCAGPICSYEVSGSTDQTSFSGSAKFDVPSLGSITGAVTSVRLDNVTDVEFSLVRLIAPDMSTIDFNLTNGFLDIAYLAPSSVMAGEYTILFEGTSGGNGSFGGNLSFGAVPEASTWAFMIVGFGLVGGALRRTKARPALKYA